VPIRENLRSSAANLPSALKSVHGFKVCSQSHLTILSLSFAPVVKNTPATISQFVMDPL
jgi:hypothetical protein